jgi:hypothetical protein
MMSGPGILLAAALYNAVWGAVAILAPRRLARVLGFSGEGDGMGWRAAGVVLVAYAPAYAWAGSHRDAAKPIIATAVLGKSIGVVGWFVGWATGRFPRRTVLLPLVNDLIWLPGLAAHLGTAPPRPSWSGR